MSEPLTPAFRQQLKAAAHELSPVAMIGKAGLTADVVAEIDRQLAKHELVKVKALSDEREEREAWLAEACKALDAQPVQHVGKVFVLYREKPAEPPPPKPEKKKRPADKPTPAELRKEAASKVVAKGRRRRTR